MSHRGASGAMRDLPILVVGVTSILTQIIVLRQFMTVSSGNELDMGITLSLWLLAVGAGSYIGHRVGSALAFGASFLVVAFFIQPTVFLISHIRSFLSLEFGETIPLATTVVLTFLSLFPVCFLLGLQFPLAVSHAGGSPSRAYGLEAAGACSGGALFSLLLSGRVDVYVLSAALSILNLTLALLLLKKRYLSLLLFIPLVFVFYFGPGRAGTMPLAKGIELIDRIESRYGEITVSRIKDQANVYSSGRFQFAYPDHETEELRAHMPMTLYPSPGRTLVIGGSLAVVREILKYPASAVDFVDLDPKMIDVSLKLLGKTDSEAIRDERVRIVTGDARRFVKKAGLAGNDRAGYDLVLLNLPEPSTANINRFYSEEFFCEVKALLRDNGILSLTLPVSHGYIGRRMQVANGSILNSLRRVFGHVEVSSEEYGYMLASNGVIDTDPSRLSERFSSRKIKTDFFRSYIFYDAFSPLKVHMVVERLGKAGMINTDLRPVAYLYNLMLWAEVHGGSALNYLLENRTWTFAILMISFVLFMVLWKKKRKAVYFSMFTTGYSTMAFSISVLLAYQALYGYVYEMIGLLASTFMLGTALGSVAMKGIRKPVRLLRFLEFLAILLFLLTPFAFRREVLFYGATFMCGMIGGMQFVTANLCLREGEAPKLSGRLYAVDLAGSSLGAFFTALCMMPLYGIKYTLLSLALMKGTSLALLASMGHEDT